MGNVKANRRSRKVIVGALIGFSYGCILALLAFAAMGAGHGSWIPFLISSAPFGVLTFLGTSGFTVSVVAGAPVVWATFGAMVATSGNPKLAWVTRTLLLLHYTAGLLLIAATTGFGELAYVLRMLRISPEIMVAWAMFYVGGQIAVHWRMGLCGRSRPDVRDGQSPT